jgi:hypothetical protein
MEVNIACLLWLLTIDTSYANFLNTYEEMM